MVRAALIDNDSSGDAITRIRRDTRYSEREGGGMEHLKKNLKEFKLVDRLMDRRIFLTNY